MKNVFWMDSTSSSFCLTIYWWFISQPISSGLDLSFLCKWFWEPCSIMGERSPFGFIPSAAIIQLVVNEFQIAVTKRNTHLSQVFLFLSIFCFIHQEKLKLIFQTLKHHLDCHKKKKNSAPWKWFFFWSLSYVFTEVTRSVALVPENWTPGTRKCFNNLTLAVFRRCSPQKRTSLLCSSLRMPVNKNKDEMAKMNGTRDMCQKQHVQHAKLASSHLTV